MSPVEPRLETCQRGCGRFHVDAAGRVSHHNEHGREGLRCWGSSQVSTEEIERRRVKREAERDAQLAELLPSASPTLDALLEERTDEDAASLLARQKDLVLAALTLFKRRNPTQPGYLTRVDASVRVCIEPSDTARRRFVFRCRFCEAGLDGMAGMHRLREAFALNRAHLTQCALEYLAGLRDPPR